MFSFFDSKGANMKRYFSLIVILVFGLLSFNTSAQLTKGLHFYMPFEEGEGNIAKDVGPKGFEATLHDTAKFVEDGKYGGAIEFSAGSAKIAEPGGKSELYTEHLTVAVWLYPYEISAEALGTGHVYGNIFFHKSGSSDDNVEFGLGNGQGLYWYINAGQKDMGPFDGTDVDITIPLPELGMQTDTWYHVVGTFDSDNLRIYLDGELKGEKPVPANGPAMIWNDNPIEFGGRGTAENSYKGLMDELVVYDRAITEDEVVRVMNARDFFAVDAGSKLTTTWGDLKIGW